MAKELYPFQSRAVRLSLESFKDKSKKDLIKIPTGCGKTLCMAATSRELLKIYPQHRTLFFAHRGFLLDQAIEEYCETIPNFDKMYGRFDAKVKQFDKQFIFASKDSLHKKSLEQYFSPMDFDAMFIDECHHCHNNAISYVRILEYFTRAKVYGYTATPKANRGKLSEIFGKNALLSVHISDMIKQGYLCMAACIRVKTNCDLTEVRKSQTTDDGFNKADIKKIIDVEKRNKIVVDSYEDLLSGNSCVVFALNKQHAHNITNEFISRGHKAACLTEETPEDERRRMKDALDSGDLKIIVNCTILTEGFNVPHLQSIIIARPIASMPLFVQIVGRVLRKSDGKDIAKVVVISDKPGKHTLMSLSDIMDGVPDFESEKIKEIVDKTGEKEEKENPWLHLANVYADGTERVNLFSGNKFDWMQVGDNYSLWLDPYRKVDCVKHGDIYKAIYTEVISMEGNIDWSISKAESYVSNCLPINLKSIIRKKTQKRKKEDTPTDKQLNFLKGQLSKEDDELLFLTKKQAGLLVGMIHNPQNPKLKKMYRWQRIKEAINTFNTMRKEFYDKDYDVV